MRLNIPHNAGVLNFGTYGGAGIPHTQLGDRCGGGCVRVGRRRGGLVLPHAGLAGAAGWSRAFGVTRRPARPAA